MPRNLRGALLQALKSSVICRIEYGEWQYRVALTPDRTHMDGRFCDGGVWRRSTPIKVDALDNEARKDVRGFQWGKWSFLISKGTRGPCHRIPSPIDVCIGTTISQNLTIT